MGDWLKSSLSIYIYTNIVTQAGWCLRSLESSLLLSYQLMVSVAWFEWYAFSSRWANASTTLFAMETSNTCAMTPASSVSAPTLQCFWKAQPQPPYLPPVQPQQRKRKARVPARQQLCPLWCQPHPKPLSQATRPAWSVSSWTSTLRSAQMGCWNCLLISLKLNGWSIGPCKKKNVGSLTRKYWESLKSLLHLYKCKGVCSLNTQKSNNISCIKVCRNFSNI